MKVKVRDHWTKQNFALGVVVTCLWLGSCRWSGNEDSKNQTNYRNCQSPVMDSDIHRPLVTEVKPEDSDTIETSREPTIRLIP
jgi:hypothetical protein